MLLEHLEQRQLLTVAPQLIGIQPNNSDLLVDGDIRDQAPRELVFRFDDAQVIDPATLDGIRITSAGGDGSFGLSSAQSDFGSGGGANIQLEAAVPGQAWNVIVSHAVLPAGTAPTIALSGADIAITLNSNVAAPTTAGELITAINSSPVLAGKLSAELNGGLADASLGQSSASTYSPISVSNSQDTKLTPGSVLIGDSPNENEVTFRFAESLKDDNYRIEVFGFDDPFAGILGLRNVSETLGAEGDLFKPSVDGTRKDTIDFRLDLGPQVQAVVPQPVVRVGTQLQQQRDTIVVYFDSDKLLVENDGAGQPTSRSVENPSFYQLIFTSDTVRNTDDSVFLPTDVKYNAATNTATLRFAGDINDLLGSSAGPATYRLRIGTSESLPIVPTRNEAAATVITDLNTDGAVKLRLTAREVGEGGNGIQVAFTNSQSGTEAVTVTGRMVTVDFGRDNLTAQELVSLLRNSSAASSLFSVDFEPGSNSSTAIGATNLAFSPVALVGLGSSFNSAMDLGVIGSATETQTSVILASAIDPESFALDLPGASDDAAHRVLPQNLNGSFENHVNEAFGADATDGITTIYYNFRSLYSFDSGGNPLTNAINEDQAARAREVLSLWANYIGVQFVETADSGLTIATGSLNGLRPAAGTTIQREAQFGVRVDPSFENSLVVLSAANTWGNDYGESYSRNFAAAIGIALGLEHAGNLPETTLMRLDPTFLAAVDTLTDSNDAVLTASDERYEAILPGNQDILHGRYLYRNDSSDIDLFKFEVDFGNDGRVGLLTAETYAQRLTNSSSLNTNLELFREVQASASTTFAAGDDLAVRFEAVAPGAQGNQLQVFFTQTNRGDASKPTILAFPNAISIDLNSTPGSESSVQDILDAITASPAASSLLTVSVEGDASTVVGGNTLTQNPVVLSGGRVELVSQNDDYFSQDSVIKQSLSTGIYYIGVSASGNDEYDASIEGTGFGGDSQGDYELRVTFRAAVDTRSTIQDIASSDGDGAVGFDGDSDGLPGGTYDFWFQTRPLDRSLSFNAGATPDLEGRIVTVTGGDGTVKTFEFSTDTFISAGRTRIPYTPASTAGDLANALAASIASQPSLGVAATANGIRLTLVGERSVEIDPLLRSIDVEGKTIFVDKAAGPNADGSLQNPFNNISAAGVPNAFEAAHSGDIVRIVGNGGSDNDIATIGDNFAYEIGAGLLAGSTLDDGQTMEVPQGVTTMIDAGAVFKLRRARIGVGSSNLNIDRSGAALQVLGAPLLTDADGNALRSPSGDAVPGSVFFTSWLDESIGLDNYSPSTSPSPGDWGGISFRRDVDTDAGRRDLEDEGIFLQYVNHADIQYGGGTVIVDSVQQTVNPIQMLNTRPTVTDNIIRGSSNAAMSALPNSFEETNFHEPRFQLSGAFTSDYDRVGPEIRRNTLLNNSVNGLFIQVDTPADGSTQTLTVPGRLDDIDIVHVLTENVEVSGAPGGSILDSTTPQSQLISTAPAVGGTLLPGIYNYKITFVDRNGYESVSSDASVSLELLANQTAVSIAGLPGATGDFVTRRLYRSQADGSGPYDLVTSLDRTSSTAFDIGNTLGGTLARDRADVSNVILTPGAAGTLAAGTYSYRLVMVDAGGRDGLASNATASIVLATDGDVTLTNLPTTLDGYTGRRLYRSSNGGVSPYVLVADLPDSTSSTTTTVIDDGTLVGGSLQPESLGITRPRINASLVFDPGTVVKLEGARIEATFGANIIAEGSDGLPVVFTSRLDDTVGAGGTFDTNNNTDSTAPSPRDWGGIYMAPTSRLSVDYARFAYGGGVTKLEGTFRAFNTIELHQAEGRIANSVFENNANGLGGQGPGTRLGRLSNSDATIFVRGTQPTIIDNVFRDNAGVVIDIDANSMTDDLQTDSGRQTGQADRDPSYLANRGPLIRNNRLEGNELNGLQIRGDTLTTASVWDDTDIVHVVFDEIFVGNIQHEGGLRLQSAPDESLVVKFDGYGSNFNDNLGAGITANGQLSTATDRVGGTLHVLGQPGFPVILTSLFDDTVGAGLRPDGRPQTDTNNDGIGSVPQAADWRGLFLDQYSNDRNVGITLETEDFTAAAPGPNGSPLTAQVLGDLASDLSSSNENRRLGFVVEGVLSQNEDVDVYSFSAAAGAEIWLDVDYTKNNLDLVIELLDANGNLLARSDNSTEEAMNPSLLVRSALVDPSSINPLATRVSSTRTSASGAVKEDGTTNPLDPGLRARLPGSPGARSNFYFRIRSASTNSDAFGAGLTKGSYQVQLRMQEAQEWAGSTVNYADIRYAMNGVHLRGLPGESPLIGEAAEDENASINTFTFPSNNGVATGNGREFTFGGSFTGDPNFFDQQTGNRPQYLGNILDTAKGALSVAGELTSSTDLDFYMVNVSQEDLVSGSGGFASVVFDLDYADGFNRPDTSINIFREEPSDSPFQQTQYRLVYTSDSSNIAEDQARPLAITDAEDLSRGSAGNADAYIGPVALAEGTYLVGVSSAALQPRTRVLYPFNVEPVDSVLRIVDEAWSTSNRTTAEPPVVQNFLPRTDIGATNELVSETFDLGGYSADDQPAIYLDYSHPGGTFDVFVRDAAGAETRVATSAFNPNLPSLSGGTNSVKIPLASATGNYDFAGQNDLTLVFRSNSPGTNIDNIIIGFAERGELNGVGNEAALLNFGFLPTNLAIESTREFSLETYLSFRESPALQFDYEVLQGNLDVFVIDQFGGATRVATTDAGNAGPTEIVLTAGAPMTGLLSMNRWADEPGLRVEFRARDENTSVSISNVHIELADGARAFTGEPNPTYIPVPVPSTTVTSGAYQLEVRLGDNYFDSQPFGAPTLTKTFDTNDRLSQQTSLIAPSGADLTDGDVFEISDGGTSIRLEFTLDGSVGLGNIPVRFTAADADFVVARAIRDAINTPSVQSRLNIRAATSGGDASGNTNDSRIHLFGIPLVRTISAGNPAGEVQVELHEGFSDENVRRHQGQVFIQNSVISDSRDYGVWSEAAKRLQDPRDLVGFERSIIQDVPAFAGTQAVRNLVVPNDGVQGGLLPGVVIQNNVLEEGGLGGIHIQGETPIWMISPSALPFTDNDPTTAAANTHFGHGIGDSNYFLIESDRTRLKFEFEDLGTTPNGDGYDVDSIPIGYRRDGGDAYHRIINNIPWTAFGTTGQETMHAFRDAVLASAFVTNGTTQQVTATIAPSMLGPDPGAPLDWQFSYPEYYNRPALYLEGVNDVQGFVRTNPGLPFDVRVVSLGAAPQAHARLINNTIIGKDGRASFNGEDALVEDNDTLETATQTWQGTAHNPTSYTDDAVIGDTPNGLSGTDVDIYQFKLDVGERAIVDIDTTGQLDSVLQIFDSRGIAQTFLNASGLAQALSDNDAAPGETLGLDPYADFTATAPGVYYAAISSVGNTDFDPLSQANRVEGTTTGAYTVSVGVSHLQDFVITAEHASSYNQGDTFTIFGVPEIGSSGSSGRTFEFTFGGGVAAGNIPINIDASWYRPDVARAIAKAITEGGPGGTPSITNAQQLDNGDFGFASPLPPVHARALGGLSGVIDAPLDSITGDRATFLDAFSDYDLNLVDELGTNHLSDREVRRLLTGDFYEINQGLELFTRRFDGVLITTSINGRTPITTSMGNLGLGHDRDVTTSASDTSLADGTTEMYVVVNNAAWIQGNGSIIVDPDQNANNNLDQILPESGILASRGSSPTVLNNVFFNVQTPIVNQEARRFPLTGVMAPYGSNNPNEVLKAGEVVIGGSIYQYPESASARLRYGNGIEESPTNIPNTGLDFNFEIGADVRLFTNAQASEFLPAAGSPLIDSSVDSLPERSSLAAVKSAMGLALSPVLTPSFDMVGQLRSDDPDVAPPSGQGQNIFKDRGALDRADFIGPAAILLDPIDNDALNIDQDGADSVVQLNSGVYPEFRIQLADGNEPANPLLGIGIDDNTVISSVIEGKRLTGAGVVVFEDGKMLQEGIDYTFAYNATRDEIILTPLAGVWKDGRVYEITVNNKDRFVITAPAGDQVADGDTFTITDENGGIVVYEFDSGYRLQVPQGLTMNIPLAGGAFGGVADGDRFSLTVGGTTTTFEFDINGNVLGGNEAISFNQGASQQEITDAVISAIQSAGLAVSTNQTSPGTIFLGAEAGTVLDTTFSTAEQPATTLAYEIPASGPRGGILDTHTFTISDGLNTETFEFDADNSSTAGNTAIDFSSAVTANDVAILVTQAIANSTLKVNPSVVSGRWVHLGLSPNGTASVGTSLLKVVGIARTLQDGEQFTVTGTGGSSKTFEFTRDATVGAGNEPISLSVNDTQDVIASRIVNAITAAGLGLSPKAVGDGNISVGGEVGNNIDVTSAPGLGLFGNPGVQSKTQLRVFGPLVVQVPATGASGITDGSVFSLSANGTTQIFEFDGDGSGPADPNYAVVNYTPLSTAADLANSLVLAINGSGLGISASNLGGAQISLGQIDASQLLVGTSGLTSFRGVVADGETFTITDGNQVITFEFDNVDLNNGFVAGQTPILFSNTSTPESLVQSMKAAIEGAGLGLTTTILPGGILELNDTPRYTTDTSNAPTIIKSGVPGGANAVTFIQDASFTGRDMKLAVIDAINASQSTNLAASDRGDATLFVANAATVSADIDSFYLRGVADLAGNFLKPNRINNETQFTILMPGVELDYGDTPDPVSTTIGRYPTKHVNDGARHVLGNVAILGANIDSESDGQPSPGASSDTNDDGVVFGANLSTPGVFNPNIMTSVDVTLNSPGFVDAWIDFNADGDWNDPGEQVLTSARFTADTLSQTFMVTVPVTAPIPASATTTYARVRSSSAGGLQPTGLAVDGEVEDYTVTVVPGEPPTAVDDTYSFNEDTTLITTDVNGTSSPGFTIDDGVAANDTDPDVGPLSVVMLQGPQHAVPGTFQFNSDGTFTYQPLPNFNGIDTIVYKVNDGVLNSNNTGTVTINVEQVNDPPVAGNDFRTINEDTVVDVEQSELLSNDTAGPANESGQTLVISGVDGISAAGGTVALIGSRVVYTPPSNYSGPDSFVYTITDNGTTAGVAAPLSASATVSLTVLDKNDVPVTSPDSLSTTEDTAATILPATLIGNDSAGPALSGQGDESGQTLTFAGVTPMSSNGGTVTYDGSVVTYTPPADFAGTDTFFYQVQDDGTSGGVSDPQTATGTVTVTVTGENDAPRVANPIGNASMQEDDPAMTIDLSSVFVDPDGDIPTFTVLSNDNSGLVTPSVTGTQLVLELMPDENGQAVIVVQAQDGAGLTVTDTLTLTVGAVNDAPRLAQAIPDVNVDEDAPAPQIVLSPTYFFDPDVAGGDTLTYAVVSNSDPLLVTPVITGDTLSLELTSNRSGGSEITISATDSSGQTVSDTFILTVNPVNDVPVTNPDSYIVKQGETLVTTDPNGAFGTSNDDGVLANDSDPEGSGLTASVVAGPTAATSFTLNANGTFTYEHDFAQGRTTDTFTYRASDGSGQSVETTVTITIDEPLPPKHQNASEHLDVNADGFVTPIDALLVINYLNGNTGDGSVANLPPPPPYRDVNGDNFITPIDVLLIVNQLNADSRGGGGEGEGHVEELQINALAGAFASQDVGQNKRIGVREIERGDQVVYGPMPSSAAEMVFADAGQADTSVDTSWVVEDSDEEVSDEPVDLALASIIGDLDGNGDA